jgi:hypothetical protein
MEELNRWMEDCEKEIDREHGIRLYEPARITSTERVCLCGLQAWDNALLGYWGRVQFLPGSMMAKIRRL